MRSGADEGCWQGYRADAVAAVDVITCKRWQFFVSYSPWHKQSEILAKFWWHVSQLLKGASCWSEEISHNRVSDQYERDGTCSKRF